MMKIKKHYKTILCILLTLSVYAYMCVVFTPKDSTDSGSSLYFQGMGFMAEPKNSLDVIMYGNSDVYSGFNPVVLKEKYGYSSYSSGKANQNVGNINTLLKETLKNQSPKLVILETDCFYAKKKVDLDKLNGLASPFVYHSRWKEIKPRDFYQIPSRKKNPDKIKGFFVSKKVQETKIKSSYMGSEYSVPKPIPQENVREIEKFLKICRENSITVLFVELPSPSSWTYAKHNAVDELAKKHNIKFIDMNIPTDEYKVDMKKDFRDNGNHLNVYGAQKATEHLGKFIDDSYPNKV